MENNDLSVCSNCGETITSDFDYEVTYEDDVANLHCHRCLRHKTAVPFHAQTWRPGKTEKDDEKS